MLLNLCIFLVNILALNFFLLTLSLFCFYLADLANLAGFIDANITAQKYCGGREVGEGSCWLVSYVNVGCMHLTSGWGKACLLDRDGAGVAV